jgi:hypothetical protein
MEALRKVFEDRTTRVSQEVYLVIMYSEIFQALVIGDILLPKPFLDLGFNNVIRWKFPVSLTNLFDVDSWPLLSLSLPFT